MEIFAERRIMFGAAAVFVVVVGSVAAVGVMVGVVVGRVVAAVAISGTEEVGAVIWRLQ
jgi:hypothetical protein